MKLLPVLALCAAAGMMSQASMISVTPFVTDSLDAPPAASPWLLTSSLIAAAVLTPLTGRLADMLGRRRTFLWCAGAVLLGCLVCTLAPTFWVLLVGRVLLGFGTSLIPLGSAILRDECDPQQLTRAVALLSASMGIGGCFGPIVGAAAVELGSWRYASAVLAGMTLCGLGLAARLVPVGADPVRGRVDAIGALGLATAVTVFLVAVTRASHWGPSSPVILGALALVAITMAAWIPWELRRRDPMVDLRLACSRPVLVVSIASILTGFGTFAYVLVIPPLVQSSSSANGSVLAAGLWIVPSGLALIGSTGVASHVMRSTSARACFVIGLAIMTAGYAAVQAAPTSTGVLVVCSIVIGSGVAFAFSALPLIVLGVTPHDQTAAAMGLNTLVRSLGTTGASAAIGMVLAAPGNDPAAIPDAAFRVALLIPLACCAAGLAISVAIPRQDASSGSARTAATIPASASSTSPRR